MYNKLKGEFMKYLKYLFLLIYISIALFICTRASVSGEASTEESDEVTDVNITTVITDMATIIHNDLTKHKVKLNLDIK